MALCIADGLFVGTAVSGLPEHRRWFPILVLQFLDGLDPVVRDVHRHAVVKAIAAILEWCSQSWHTAHFLSDGDSLWFHLMNHKVCQREISNCIVVFMSVIVIAITSECLTQSVAVVEHGSDTIEAIAIEMEFLKPVLAVGKQEMEHLVVAIVEAK